MNPLPLLLIAVSTVTHAYWNFLLKRAKGTQTFIALSKLVEVVVFAPVALALFIQAPPPLAQFWWLIVGAAVITTAYYVALGTAYNKGNLSLVYPVARAGSLAFLPILAFVFIQEQIDWVGGVAISIIILGIFIIQLEGLDRAAVGRLLAGASQPALLWALAAAFLAAAYSLWDKYALRYLPVFLYYYVYTVVSAAAYIFVLAAGSSQHKLGDEFRAHNKEIAQVALISMFTYMLVLFALQNGKTSYVIALRQLSVGASALMGRFWLGEHFGGHRWVGLGVLLAGCIMVSLAR